MNHAKNQGAESFGAVGTCWGSYPVVKMSGAGLIKCGVRSSSRIIISISRAAYKLET